MVTQTARLINLNAVGVAQVRPHLRFIVFDRDLKLVRCRSFVLCLVDRAQRLEFALGLRRPPWPFTFAKTWLFRLYIHIQLLQVLVLNHNLLLIFCTLLANCQRTCHHCLRFRLFIVLCLLCCSLLFNKFILFNLSNFFQSPYERSHVEVMRVRLWI